MTMTTVHPEFVGDKAVLPRDEFDRLVQSSQVIIIIDSQRWDTDKETPERFEAWLAECERVAALWEGEFDSAADLRRIRDEE